MKIPSKLTQGDSLVWKDEPTKDNLGNSIDSGLWTLKYAIRGPTSLDLTASSSGSGWQTSITSAQTAALSSGIHYWQAFAEKGSERYTLGNGRIDIVKNLALVSGTHDGRSQLRIDLDNVQAAMRALVSGGAVQKYSIGNRSFEKMTLSELRELESSLKFQVAQEERTEMIKAGLGDPNNVRVRF